VVVCSDLEAIDMYLNPEVKKDKQERKNKIFKAVLSSDTPFRPCHFLVYNSDRKEIVVAARGTMSLNEALIDGVCEYAPWGKGFVHKGFAWATNWLVGEVITDIINFVREEKEREKVEIKRIISTGHSLGGAVSTLFAITLGEYISSLPSEHPLHGLEVICHAFAPPPTMSEEIYGEYQNKIYNYTYNVDIVPRLSFGSLLDTKSMILIALDTYESAGQKAKQFIPKFMRNAMSMENIQLRQLTEEERSKHSKLYQPGKIFWIHKDPKQKGNYVTEVVETKKI